jgi:hypothetical protein
MSTPFAAANDNGKNGAPGFCCTRRWCWMELHVRGGLNIPHRHFMFFLSAVIYDAGVSSFFLASRGSHRALFLLSYSVSLRTQICRNARIAQVKSHRGSFAYKQRLCLS